MPPARREHFKDDSADILAGGWRFRASSLVTLFFAIYAMKVATTLTFYQETPKQGTAVNAAVTLAFFALLVLLIVFRAVEWTRVTWGLDTALALSFVAWTGLSLRWTEAHSISSAAGYWGEAALEVVIVWLLAGIAPRRLLVLRALQGFVMGTVLVLIDVVVLGERGADGRLGNEAFLHPNTLGYRLALAALCAMFLATYRDQRAVMWSRRLWGAMTLICVVGLAASLSKTAIAAFFGGVLILFIRREISPAARAVAVTAGVLVAIGASGSVLGYWNEYAGGASHSLTTLTGRTDIWHATWPLIHEAPYIGYGVLSFRDVGPQIAAVRLVHAHNELIQLLFTVGLVGVLLAAAPYLTFGLRMLRSNIAPDEVSYRSIALAILAFILLRGITEANEVMLLYPLPMFFALSFALPRRNR
jgi:O-antigen ligase